MIEQIDKAVETIQTAKRNKRPLSGNGFYAKKFVQLESALRAKAKEVAKRLSADASPEVTLALNDFHGEMESMCDNALSHRERLRAGATLRSIYTLRLQPSLGTAPHVASDDLFPIELAKHTRGYIEKIATQACGAYDKGWYDACAVMCRRLLETLIIELFEAKGIAAIIQDSKGNFFYLRDLIRETLTQNAWILSRNCKTGLPDLKDLGDLSAHSRRFVATKSDVDNVRKSLRVVIEELLSLSGLK